MSLEDSERVDDLRAVVAVLSKNLGVSERRTARLERIIGWGALTITLTLGLTLIAALQPLGYAVVQPGSEPSRSAEEAIDRLTQSLTGPQSTLGQMGMMMQNMMVSVTRRARSETEQIPASMQMGDCRVAATVPGSAPPGDEIKQARTTYPLGYYAKCFFLENDIRPVNGVYRDEDYQAAVVSAMGGAAVEMGVLVHRIRHDSDFAQGLQALLDRLSPGAALEGITQQLTTLNRALASVPQMTNNMSVMTQQMGVMTADMTAMTHHMGSMNHSVGSTMGRMGSWMPW